MDLLTGELQRCKLSCCWIRAGSKQIFREDYMTKKIGDDVTKNEVDPAAELSHIERARLLVSVAGHVAGGLIVSPSPKVDTPEKIAIVAVELAEAILKKAGV